MLRQRQSLAPATEAKRRPPDDLLVVLALPEEKAREAMEELFRSPAFQLLVLTGAVRRKWRPRRHRASNKAWRELFAFVRQCRLEEQSSAWVSDFADRHTTRRISELMGRYGLAESKVRWLARMVRTLLSDEVSMGTGKTGDLAGVARAAGAESMLAGQGMATERIAALVERYGLTRDDFVTDFLGGEPDARLLASRYGIPVDDVQGVLDAIGMVQAFDWTCRLSLSAIRQISPATLSIIAEVGWVSGRLSVKFAGSAAAAGLFEVDDNRLAEIGLSPRDPWVQPTLATIRALNERIVLIRRIVLSLTAAQEAYLKTQDKCDLRPLSQAELSGSLGVAPSSVSRAIRGRAIRAGDAVIALPKLCASSRDVVTALGERHPDATSKQIVDMLQSRFGYALSPRTVSYHRQRARVANPLGDHS